MSKLTGPHHRTVKRGLKMAKPKCHKCEEKCGKGKANPEIVEKLDRAYKDFLKTDSKSLLKKHLTPDVFDRLRQRKTALGSTLLDCVRSGLENPDSAVGLYAADPDCYALFADVFDPVIRDYHAGAGAAAHPPPDWGGAAQGLLGNLDPEGAHVVSTRVRCCRNLRGYAFHPRLQEAQYEEIEAKVTGALRELRGPLRGAYRPLASMDEETRRRLVDEHLLFKEGDRFLRAADACRFWPAGRGIFLNDARTFLAWVNEEDHARLISLQPGGHLGEVYQRLVEGVGELEKRLAFLRDERLGYLTFCPTNLGTTIRASVHVRVPRLAEDEEKLNELAERYHLQVRGTSGEHSAAEGGVYDISNKRRLGLTEYQVVKEMFDGVAEILKREKSGGY